MAYRIIADHARMFTVAIADGLRPGRKDLDSKLRTIIHRAVRRSRSLGGHLGFLGSLVPVVVESLGHAYPELSTNPAEIVEVVNITEEKYTRNLVIGHRTMQKAVNKYGSVGHLSAEQMWEIYEGRFGQPVPVDVLNDLADDLHLTLDNAGFQKKLQESKDKATGDSLAPSHHKGCDLDLQDVYFLQEKGIPVTDDSYKFNYKKEVSGYAVESVTGMVVSLKHAGRFVDSVEAGESCSILVDRTCFYAESGGQKADRGDISTEQGGVMEVEDVQERRQYVLHIGSVKSGRLSVGDSVSLTVHQGERENTMRNHTATHLLNSALNTVLGNVRQQGSLVSAEKLTFDFTCSKVEISQQQLREVDLILQDFVSCQLPVDMTEAKYNHAKNIAGLRTLQDEVYPETVRLVSVGVPAQDLLIEPQKQHGVHSSIELCGGTHVKNTGDIEAVVITNLQGATQGTKRITAVTGECAKEVLKESAELQDRLKELTVAIATGKDSHQWLAMMADMKKILGEAVLPKVDRETILNQLESLEVSSLNKQKNRNIKDRYKQDVTDCLSRHRNAPVIVTELDFMKTRDMAAAMHEMTFDKPVMVLSQPEKRKGRAIGVCIVPECSVKDGFTSESWAEWLSSTMPEGSYKCPQGKLAKRASVIHTLVFRIPENQTLERATELAQEFANRFVK